MKVQKMFTIDEELVSKLKDVKNVSGLINSLLIKYFDVVATPEQRKAKINALQEKIRKEIEEDERLKNEIEKRIEVNKNAIS